MRMEKDSWRLAFTLVASQVIAMMITMAIWIAIFGTKGRFVPILIGVAAGTITRAIIQIKLTANQTRFRIPKALK